MPRKKKQEIQQNTEVQLAEDQSTPTTASSVVDTTSPVEALLGGNAGYIVLCENCKAKIWIHQYDDNLVYICSNCSELYE